MQQEHPQRRRLLLVLGGVILLALMLLCYVQMTPFVRARFTTLLLPTSNVAPPACAHQTPDTPRGPLQEDLFVAVTSSVTSGTAGLISRGARIVDANDALCIVRSSDGAIVGHYMLDYAVEDLAQADGVLYALQRYNKPGDAQVCAIHASDGMRLWCQRSSSPNIMPLVLNGGILYIQGDTVITALRASDGAVLWTHPIQRGSDEQSRFVELAVVSDSVYIPVSTNRVCALRTIDGTTRWCTSPGTLSDAIRLVADAGGVYVLDRSSNPDSPTRIVALRSTDGAIIWQRPFQRIATIATSSLVTQNGLLYLSTFSSPASPFQEIFTALQTSDGTTRWEATMGLSLVATVQGNVAYLADSTSLQAHEASTGKLLWKQRVRRTKSMLVSGNMLYLSDDVQGLFAVKASTGQVLWERIQCIDDSDIIASEPHTKNGTVVWCTWGTDRLKNGLAAPTVLATGT